MRDERVAVLRLASLLAMLQYEAHATLFTSTWPRGIRAARGDESSPLPLRRLQPQLLGLLLRLRLNRDPVGRHRGRRAVAGRDAGQNRSVARPADHRALHAILAWHYFFLAPVVGDAVVRHALPISIRPAVPVASTAERAGRMRLGELKRGVRGSRTPCLRRCCRAT